ncbi:hypothetical protein M422DRAFT_155027 [Sphaerobolus stellatus SS14]|nr:hypothetical protein M422DRAFT_155027 [Sphaerobolus stellatus SS14]
MRGASRGTTADETDAAAAEARGVDGTLASAYFALLLLLVAELSRSFFLCSRGGGGGDRGEAGTNPGNNLHVSGLSHKVDNRDLEAAFSKYGRVQKASVMYDPHTRESRGFGFVTMESSEEADAAITGLNGTDLNGKVMNVEKVSYPPSYVKHVCSSPQARRGRARTPTPGRYYGPPKRGNCGIDSYRSLR